VDLAIPIQSTPILTPLRGKGEWKEEQEEENAYSAILN